MIITPTKNLENHDNLYGQSSNMSRYSLENTPYYILSPRQSKKNVITRLANQMDEFILETNEYMSTYWSTLQKHIPIGDAADPEILGLIREHKRPIERI